MKRLLNILDTIINGMTFLAGLLLVFIMLTVCADVILRTFFKMPQMWVTEVIECLLLYITFLATAWLLREEGHVQVDILVNRLKPRTVAFFGIISSVIGVFISLVLTVFGTTVTWDYFQRGIYTPSVMEIPVSLIIVIIPVGSLLLLAQFIRRTVKNFAGFIIETAESRSES